MSLFDTLLGIFTDDDTNTEFNQNPEGFLNQNGLGNVTSQDIEAEMPRVLEAIQGNSGGATQGGAASFAGSGNVTLPPPPAPSGGEGGGYEGGLSGAIESINHYTNVFNETNQSFQDNDVTNIDDSDTTVDASVNQNITAFGDVTQDFDNDVVSGDGAVAAGDNAQVNTGAGAVQAGDDIEDSNVVTGTVEDSVLADDIDDSIIGDDNQAIIDSNVGAATFGEGDATNVSAQNANVGDGVQVVGSDDTNVNTGEGDLITIDDSTVEESQLGGEGNTLVSNDVDIDAEDGSAVAFGSGSEADAQQQNVAIEDNYGQVQVAGDDATQTVDQSYTETITDSYNDQSVNDSYNVADSGNVDASDDDGVDLDNSLNQNDLSDDDVIDVL
jgi:hypothetical protein